MSRLRSAQRKFNPRSSVAGRYQMLSATHLGLDQQLDEEIKRPLPDSAAIQRIKRRKLAIKDEMTAIERLFDAIGASANYALSHDENHQQPRSVITGRGTPRAKEIRSV